MTSAVTLPGHGLPGGRAYLYNHLHSGQCGAKVLGVWGSHSDRHTAAVQAAIECSNKVNPWGDRATWSTLGSREQAHNFRSDEDNLEHLSTDRDGTSRHEFLLIQPCLTPNDKVGIHQT